MRTIGAQNQVREGQRRRKETAGWKEKVSPETGDGVAVQQARTGEDAKAGTVEEEAVEVPIGELARLAGVSTRTLRYYEEIGLLRTAKRYAGGRRVFDGDALQRLRFISRLKTLGFSLEEIRHLNEVFEVERSTAAMLNVLDDLLGDHQNTLEQRLKEVTALNNELGAYRRHIRARLEELQGR